MTKTKSVTCATTAPWFKTEDRCASLFTPFAAMSLRRCVLNPTNKDLYGFPVRVIRSGWILSRGLESGPEWSLLKRSVVRLKTFPSSPRTGSI